MFCYAKSMYLFVYGTLTFPSIVKALTGRSYLMQTATLSNYFINSLDQKPYPGLTASHSESASGYILVNVDRSAFKILDAWEGDEYRKVSVTAHTSSGSVKTLAYVWDGPLKQLTAQPWDRNEFTRLHLAWYLKNKIPEFKQSLNM